MRSEAVHLVRQAVSAGRYAYVLVNNRAQGNAPATVQGLVGMGPGSGSIDRGMFERAQFN
jgi:hypothetical protein